MPIAHRAQINKWSHLMFYPFSAR